LAEKISFADYFLRPIFNPITRYGSKITKNNHAKAMITAAKIFLPSGESIDYVVGKDVSKIFFDREKENVLIVLTTDNIVEYHDCLSIVQKDYKEVK